MATSSILVLGSPIKEHLAPSMLGPAVVSAAATSGPTVASGPAAGILTAGHGLATTAGVATGSTVVKTLAMGSVIGSLFYTAAVVAAGYLGYRATKALLAPATKKTAEA